MIEERFRDCSEFRRAWLAERDLFYRAVEAPEPEVARALAAEALELASRRHARFFQGLDSVYAELESLFLNMEGVAEWVRYRHLQADRERFPTDADIIAFRRAKANSWSQDQGLALFLLIDRFSAGKWQIRALGQEVASPLALLSEALGEADPPSPACRYPERPTYLDTPRPDW